MSNQPLPEAGRPGGHAADRLREQLERDFAEVPDGLGPDQAEARRRSDEPQLADDPSASAPEE
jgi:hypothetical protein